MSNSVTKSPSRNVSRGCLPSKKDFDHVPVFVGVAVGDGFVGHRRASGPARRFAFPPGLRRRDLGLRRLKNTLASLSSVLTASEYSGPRTS